MAGIDGWMGGWGRGGWGASDFCFEGQGYVPAHPCSHCSVDTVVSSSRKFMGGVARLLGGCLVYAGGWVGGSCWVWLGK